MPEAIMDMFVTGLVTAILSFVLTFALWRLVERPGAKPSRPKPLTLRISNIPGNITKEKFRDILTVLAEKLNTSPTAADWPQLLGWSFARSGHSEASFVATATFRVPPAPIQLESAIKHAIGVGSDHLRVDMDFFGLTPLADPQDAAVE
jgi:hypothetical protein